MKGRVSEGEPGLGDSTADGPGVGVAGINRSAEEGDPGIVLAIGFEGVGRDDDRRGGAGRGTRLIKVRCAEGGFVRAGQAEIINFELDEVVLGAADQDGLARGVGLAHGL